MAKMVYKLGREVRFSSLTKQERSAINEIAIDCGLQDDTWRLDFLMGCGDIGIGQTGSGRPIAYYDSEMSFSAIYIDTDEYMTDAEIECEIYGE